MKKQNTDILLRALYNTHSTSIIDRKNKKYLKLFEQYNDIVSNINDENLKARIIYSHLNIEELLFGYISYTSRLFYELGFNDFKSLLLKNQNMD